MDEVKPNETFTPDLELRGLPPDHDVAKLWPRMSGAEKERVCKSIKKGIPETVYVWTDPAGKDWLVYGRERAELWASLVDDDEIDATKIPLRMANLGPLTEHEMIEHVVFTLNRGWGKPGQRAVIAVLANRLLRSAHPEKDGKGDQAQALADKLGVSRPLIFEAKRLVEEDFELAQDVLNRRVNLHPAYETLRPPQPLPTPFTIENALLSQARPMSRLCGERQAGLSDERFQKVGAELEIDQLLDDVVQ